MVSRIHHCIADGIALVGVTLSLTDCDRAAAAPAATPMTLVAQVESTARGCRTCSRSLATRSAAIDAHR